MRRVGSLVLIGAVSLIVFLVTRRPGEGPTHAGGERRDEAPSASQGIVERMSPGTVLDAETGAPVAGARLTLYRVSPPVPQPAGTFVTDAAGGFSVPLKTQDEASRLVVEAEGYPLQAAWFDPLGTEIELERGEEATLTIVDSEGRAAAGAAIDVLASGDLLLWSTQSDADGVATLRLTANETLLVRFPGHAYEDLQRHVSGVWQADVALVPEYTIGGRVVDSAGEPVPGASVELRQGTDCKIVSEYGPTIVSGRDGGFLFHGVHGCACELTVEAPGRFRRRLGAAPGDEKMRIVMRRAATASGIVVMPDGSPAKGAEVRLEWRYEDQGRDGTTADAEGRFELADIEPCRQEITAFVDGGLHARIEIAPGEGETAAGLRLELRPPGTEGSFLRVQVLDERGRAVQGAAVAAHNGRESTDRDGLASLDTGAPPGFATTIAITPPAAEGERLIGTYVRAITSSRPDEAPLLGIVLHDGALVRVEARAADGTPVNGASADLFRDGIDSGVSVGNPREKEGVWVVDPYDTYVVRVRASGFILFETRRWRPCDAKGAFIATLRPCASVKGRAVDEQGIPLDEVHATVDFRLDHMGTGRRLTCGPGGSFLLEGLEEGTGMLTLGRGRGDPQAGVEITTLAGEVTDVGRLALAPNFPAHGKVVDPEGSPIGGAWVTAETGLPDCYISTYTRADGVFSIVLPGFAQGCLVVRKGGFGTVRVPISRGSGGTLGDVAMPIAGALDVEVDGVDWRTIEYLTVDVASQTAPVGSAAEHVFWPLDSRPYRINDIAPGLHVARLTAGSLSTQEEVRIVAGETAKVTFRMGGTEPHR